MTLRSVNSNYERIFNDIESDVNETASLSRWWNDNNKENYPVYIFIDKNRESVDYKSNNISYVI